VEKSAVCRNVFCLRKIVLIVKNSTFAGIIGVIIAFVLILFFVPNFGQNQSGNFIDFRCGGNALCFSGTINRIIDGDTLEIDGVRVRLALTSTPELSEEYGADAREFTSEFCPIGSNAIVDEDDMQTGGSFGRLIGKVFCEKGLLNSALLENNLAYIDERFCSTSEFVSEDWVKKYGC
jgi:endonuclease YncB( thermonuclease family)